MKYKPDWADAQRRLAALWHGERLDRPCIAVRAPLEVAEPTPVPEPEDDEARWLDPAYRVPLALRQLEETWWGGEAVPSCLQMAGWVNCLGGSPHFSPSTIWFDTRKVDFDRPSPFRQEANASWTAKFRTLLVALCEIAGRDEFLLGAPGHLPANDLLSMHMGTQAFLTELVDHPDWMADAILTGARDLAANRKAMQQVLRDCGHEYWYGNGGWMAFWAPEPYYATQSDVSCMISPEMFDRFVLPELDEYGEEHGALWYHLDGADAKQHLPRLLSRPYTRVIQYVPALFEPLNGPAHLEMYRQIQAAGRIVHIELPVENVEPLVRQLDPGLLMLDVHVATRDDGERLLEQCVEWARRSPRAATQNRPEVKLTPQT